MKVFIVIFSNYILTTHPSITFPPSSLPFPLIPYLSPSISYHFNFQNLIIYFLCIGTCLHVCVCTTCLPSGGGQKREPDLLAMELQIVVTFHVCAGNQT